MRFWRCRRRRAAATPAVQQQAGEFALKMADKFEMSRAQVEDMCRRLEVGHEAMLRRLGIEKNP